MDMSSNIVIVGAGLAGARAAQALRACGHAGAVTLLGAESTVPYDRPPLSKAVLCGTQDEAECVLLAPELAASQRIDLRTGAAVVSIDRAAHTVTLANGEVLPYDRLLLATGAEPRRLSVRGAELPGVHYLRTLEDARELREALQPGRRLAIVGGGFIGLEVAASAAQSGCEVVVLEAGERLLMRAVPAAIAAHIENRHRAAGVEFRFGVQLAAIEGAECARRVRLESGEEIACDAVVVGIGAAPRTALAASAALDIDNGIAVDACLRTSDPDIYAIGDVCSFPHPLAGGRRIRLECWKNAEAQAERVARNLLGADDAYVAVPWFWSDQYELSIQIAGLPMFASETVERPMSGDARMLFRLADDGRLVAASAVGGNAIGREVRLAQMLIERNARPSREALADPSVRLKSLLATETA
jgi:3-phenylpropionate/trans-cinnamate dioxygenase ferredoxin reductase subunit